MTKERMPVGTDVVVIRDNGEAEVTKTRSAPWQIGSHWVVLLDGIAGCYSLQRVAPIKRKAGAL